MSFTDALLWSELPASGPRPRAWELLPAVSNDAARADRELMSAVAEPNRVLFLDIETTGLTKYYDEITLVGFAIGGAYRVHVLGDPCDDLRCALREASALVTFNGTHFDIPFLQKTFGQLVLPKVHVDLRYAAKRAGLAGGQKAIEQALGIDVRLGLESVDGAAAVLLWHRYLRHDLDALRKLIAYNAADIRGMQGILDHLLDRQTHADFLIGNPRFSQSDLKRAGWSAFDCELPSPIRLGRRAPTFPETFGGSPAANATIVGIDLTGSESKASGFCILRGDHAETAMIATDDQLVQAALSAKPAVISIDSPLSLPRGRIRVTDDDPGRQEFGIMRQCERTLKRRGVNVYPCLLPSMQRLTERGIRLAGRFRALGVPVIESYPGGAQDIMGIPRKGAGEAWLKAGLAEFGVSGDFVEAPVTHDELDAITCALVGSFFLAGKFEALSGDDEGALVIPDLKAIAKPPVLGISGRIGAGKTTIARQLEAKGFAYTRFSLVIDEEIRRRGLEPDRRTRQAVGMALHEEKGQRWLCERVLESVPSDTPIAIDGLRWPEDVAFFKEKFGSDFVHLHVRASPEHRRTRFDTQDAAGISFDHADSQPVEAMIDELAPIADITMINELSLDDLYAQVDELSERITGNRSGLCRSRLS